MAKKALGQHFLSDPRILSRIADQLPAAPGDPVLEIGPGKGALTRVLLARGFRVVAIERDRDLVPTLRTTFPTLHLIEGDALTVDWVEAMGRPERWFLAGNIPYNITTPLIDQALEARPAPTAIVFLIQQEVALRLAAAPGSSDYGALSVGAQAAARIERCFSVGAGSFQPPPKVDSAVVRLTPKPEAERVPDPASFRRFVVGLFTARRKQLVRALRTAFDFSADAATALVATADLTPDQRAETLTVGEFRRLHQLIVDGGMSDRLTL